MEGALAWIGQIAEWIGRFFPRVIVLPTTLGGVKFKAHIFPKLRKIEPMTVEACGPGGVFVYWPFLTAWDTYPMAGQTDDLRSQIITTTDGRTIAVGGMVTYEVTDIALLLTARYSPMKAISDICLTAIHDECCRMSWDELRAEQAKGTLATRLKNRANRALEPLGVKVTKLQLTDLAPARVLKVIQSVGKDED